MAFSEHWFHFKVLCFLVLLEFVNSNICGVGSLEVFWLSANLGNTLFLAFASLLLEICTPGWLQAIAVVYQGPGDN